MQIPRRRRGPFINDTRFWITTGGRIERVTCQHFIPKNRIIVINRQRPSQPRVHCIGNIGVHGYTSPRGEALSVPVLFVAAGDPLVFAPLVF